MDLNDLRKLTKNKTKSFPVRLNPKLLELFDKALDDSDFSSRNDFIESSIIDFINSKGLI